MLLYYVYASAGGGGYATLTFHVVKAYLRRHNKRFRDSLYPELDLQEAFLSVTPEKARGFFAHAGYEL